MKRIHKKIFKPYFCTLFIVIFLLQHVVFSQEPLHVLWQENPKSIDNTEFTYIPSSPSYCSVFERKICRWKLLKKQNIVTEEYSWIVIQADMASHETKMFEITPSKGDLQKNRVASRLVTNPQLEISLIISHNGKNFLLRYFNGDSFLYDGQSGRQVTLNTIPKNESLLGFNTNGDLFCGTQCLNPLLVLRNSKTGEIVRKFNFQKMSYFPDTPIKPECWIGNHIDYNNAGLLYSNLPSPIESKDGKTTIVVLTVFQFEFHLALLIVYDNENGFVITQSLVDTTNWFEKNNVLFSSDDSNYIAVHDGRQKLMLFDRKNRCFSKVCNISQLHPDPFLCINQACFLPDGQIAMTLSCYDGILSYLWHPLTGEFTIPYWTSKGNNSSEIISISPDGRFIATGHRNEIFQKCFFDLFDKNITFWETEKHKDVLKLDINPTANIFIASDWSILEINKSDNTGSHIRQIFDLSKNFFDNKQFKNAERSIPFFRTWTTVDGKFSTDAQFITVKDDKVVLKKEDGKEISVPLEKLSDADKKYVQEYSNKIEK